MQPRSTQSQENNFLSTAEDLLKDFKEKYKCTEDYYPRYLAPHVTLANIKEHISTKNTDLFKRFFIQYATGMLFEVLMEKYYATYGGGAQRLALDNIVLQLTGHGECGISAGGLLYELLQQGAFQ